MKYNAMLQLPDADARARDQRAMVSRSKTLGMHAATVTAAVRLRVERSNRTLEASKVLVEAMDERLASDRGYRTLTP